MSKQLEEILDQGLGFKEEANFLSKCKETPSKQQPTPSVIRLNDAFASTENMFPQIQQIDSVVCNGDVKQH